MAIDIQTTLCIGTITFGALLIARKWMISQSALLPPSPPSDPIIGHARYIPLEYSWKTFSAWRKSFGEHALRVLQSRALTCYLFAPR